MLDHMISFATIIHYVLHLYITGLCKCNTTPGVVVKNSNGVTALHPDRIFHHDGTNIISHCDLLFHLLRGGGRGQDVAAGAGLSSRLCGHYDGLAEKGMAHPSTKLTAGGAWRRGWCSGRITSKCQPQTANLHRPVGALSPLRNHVDPVGCSAFRRFWATIQSE